MNPLTHAHFALELFKDQNLTQDQKDHLIVGSIIPDLHISGLIQFHKTHTRSKDFFHSLKNPLHKYFALGMISHGEEPRGLDHHTHNGNGYIKQKQNLVLPLAHKYQKHIGHIDHHTIHYLIEFSVDNLVAEKNPLIVNQVLAAFKNPKINQAITAFSNHFEFSERKNLRTIALFRNKHLLNYFRNFSLPETTSQNWINLTFYRNLKKGKNLPFREKLKKMTQFSYYNLKRKISNRQLTQFFHEINSYLRNDVHEFLSQSQKDLQTIKNELLKHIDPKKG